LRCNNLAGTTPSGKGIKDNDIVLLDRSVELGLAIHKI
jgi:hypothetical protein